MSGQGFSRSRRKFGQLRSYWLLAACVFGASLLSEAGCRKGSSGPELPALATYAKLPAVFHRELATARKNATEGSFDPEKVRRLARLYQANRLFAEARQCYRVMAARGVALSARDHYYLADIAANENDLDRDREELRATIAADPKYLPARLALADAAFKSGHEDEAAKEFAEVLKIDPNDASAQLGLARIDLERGDEDAAVNRLEDLMDGHPSCTAGAAVFAKILERRGEKDRADAMVQLSQQKPEPPVPDPWLSALLADCYDAQRLSIAFEEDFKLGRMEEALPLLDRLSELDPKSPVAKIFAGFSHARALQHIAAIRDYYDALQRGGDPEKICPYLVTSLLALGKVSEADGVLAGYYAKMPNSLPIVKAYAEVALREKNDRLARELLTKVLQKEPYLRPQNMSLAQILWTAGDRDGAAKLLERVAKTAPRDIASRALLGEYYLGKAKPEAAIPLLVAASRHASPNTPVEKNLQAMLLTAYVQVGTAQTEAGHFAEAATSFQNALQANPKTLEAYAGLANADLQLKHFRAAAETLEKLVALQPDNPTILLSAGDAWYQDGQAEKARQQWQAALPLCAPGDAELRQALNERLSGHVSAETFR